MRPLRVLLLLSCTCACASADETDRRQLAMDTMRANLETACQGQAECLQVIEAHFAACFEEYVAATERDGHADPKVMAACMNRRAGREWFGWREN